MQSEPWKLNIIMNDIIEQIKQLRADLDDLIKKFNDLYEKTESIDIFIHGYVKSLGAELTNQRMAFYYLYKALGIPYDEIKGWDINNEICEMGSHKRRPLGFLRKAIQRKGRKKNV